MRHAYDKYTLDVREGARTEGEREKPFAYVNKHALLNQWHARLCARASARKATLSWAEFGRNSFFGMVFSGPDPRGQVRVHWLEEGEAWPAGGDGRKTPTPALGGGQGVLMECERTMTGSSVEHDCPEEHCGREHHCPEEHQRPEHHCHEEQHCHQEDRCHENHNEAEIYRELFLCAGD